MTALLCRELFTLYQAHVVYLYTVVIQLLYYNGLL